MQESDRLVCTFSMINHWIVGKIKNIKHDFYIMRSDKLQFLSSFDFCIFFTLYSKVSTFYLRRKVLFPYYDQTSELTSLIIKLSEIFINDNFQIKPILQTSFSDINF